MRLTMYTDFSLRVLIYLGTKEPGQLSTVQEISDSFQISKNHLTKVAHELGKLGLLETVRGRGGGIRLRVKPEDINIGALIRQTEDDFHLVECFVPGSTACKIAPACRLKGALAQAMTAYLAVLDSYTLADFLTNQEELAAILFEPTL